MVVIYMDIRYDKSMYFDQNSTLCVVKRHSTVTQLHAHDFFEFEIILDGYGKQRLNGVECVLQPGSIYLLTPSDFHEILPGSDLQLWNISFTAEIIPADKLHFLCNGAKPIFRQLEATELRRLDLAASLLHEEYLCNGCMAPLFTYLLTLVLRYDQAEEPPTPIQKASFYIDTHFREHPAVAQVAQQVCLSPVYFGSLFKQYTGMTYVKYLNSRRVSCAKMLLDNGWTVTDTCYEAGFCSLSSFLHTFRQETGVSPNQYKSANKMHTKL